MGLDNGIILKKRKSELNVPDNVKFFFQEYKDERNLDYVDVCYFRKYWGFRNMVMNTMYGVSEFDYEKKITADDAEMILECIKYFDNEDVWDYEGDSIWTYQDATRQIAVNVANLEWLIEYLREHPDEECYWYDSY